VMGKITRQQPDTYLLDGGSRCPFCSSREMVSEIVQYDRLGGVIHCEVQCMKCKHEWIDVFTLTGVLDEDARE